MQVLHLAPLWYPVARDAPGGIETLLPGLIAALEARGCRNTLLASGDSRTAAEPWPVVPRHLCAAMEAGTAWEYAAYEQHQLLLALERATEFDVVHSHAGPGALALSGVPALRGRVLHTLHNPVTPDLEWFAGQHPEVWFATVSEFQARPLRRAEADRCWVVPNGCEVDSFTFDPRGGEGLFFIGRMEWEKGPDLAVAVARALGCPLVLAGPIVDGAFFDRAIRPSLDDRVRYVGTVDHRRKDELFGRAGCVLVPSRWDEPFGLVAIEAMACGTPVVALARGALPEVIEPGLTGFLAPDEDALAPLVQRALALNRAAIRARVAARFDVAIAADAYRRLYERIRDTSG